MSISPTDAMEIILKKQDEYRRSALTHPKGKEAYDYGEVVGINKGFQIAIDALAAANKENSGLAED